MTESERDCQYRWAAKMAVGRDVFDARCGSGGGSAIMASAGARSVVGIDVDSEAVGAAMRNSTSERVEFRVADIQQLSIADNSFDLAVCFDVVEYLAPRDVALAELRRVVRPDGLLAISLAKPTVGTSGASHHADDDRPGEMGACLQRHFRNVQLFYQSSCLAMAILNRASATGHPQDAAVRLVNTAPSRVGDETFTLALASDVELATPQALVMMGAELGSESWAERLDAAQETAVAARREAHRALQGEVGARASSLETARQLLAVEEQFASALARIGALDEQVAQATSGWAELQRSPSWRVTAPLRAARDVAGRVRARRD